MKKIFTLFASLFLTMAIFAADARPTSSLTIKSVNSGDIRVVLDGKRYEPNDNALMIQGLDEGTHAIKVYREKTSGAFSMFGKRYDLVYNTNIQLKRRTQLFITIEKNGWVTMQENKVRKTRDNKQPVFDYDRDGKLGDYDSHNAYDRGMSSNEFNRVLQSIDKEWLEGNKIKSATQVVRNNELSAAQVKELVLLFTFENNKLELAKQAYLNTVDKQNYSIIFDAFTFNSSRVALQDYIKTCR